MKKRLLSIVMAVVLVSMMSFGFGSLQVEAAGKKNDTLHSTLEFIKSFGDVQWFSADGSRKEQVGTLWLEPGDYFETGADSTVGFVLDGTKKLLLDENSKMVCRMSGNNVLLDVETGELFFEITDKLQKNETFKMTSGGLLVDIRGTSGAITPKDAKAFDGVLGLTIYPELQENNNGAQNTGNSIELPLVAGNGIDVEKVMETARAYLDAGLPEDELTAKMEEAAQPAPLVPEALNDFEIGNIVNNERLREVVPEATGWDIGKMDQEHTVRTEQKQQKQLQLYEEFQEVLRESEREQREQELIGQAINEAAAEKARAEDGYVPIPESDVEPEIEPIGV